LTEHALPETSIVVPTLNEAEHVRVVIAQLLPPTRGAGFVRELIVADGESTDGTKEIVEALARADPRIRLVRNAKRLQSAGINLAVAAADPKSEVIVRADAHSDYPDGFVQQVVATLVASGADSVVVRLRTEGRGCFQKAIAAAANSPAGSGGSRHRVGGESGFVDHGHHAAFRRRILFEVGGYDESFVANEDAELDVRIRKAGGRIWFENAIEVTYYPRRTPTALARQYLRYGRGRAQTFRKHGERLKLRQIAPPALAILMAFSLLATVVTPWALVVPAVYIGLLCLVGLLIAFKLREPCALAIPLVLGITQIFWGIGFLHGAATTSVSDGSQ